MGNNGVLITVAVIAIPFIFTLIVVWIKSLEKRKNRELMAELYRKSIENGRELPPDLFEPKNKNNSLRTGIILIFVGIGISIFMALTSNQEDMIKSVAGGIIPFFLGIGFIIIHYIWKKKGYSDED